MVPGPGQFFSIGPWSLVALVCGPWSQPGTFSGNFLLWSLVPIKTEQMVLVPSAMVPGPGTILSKCPWSREPHSEPQHLTFSVCKAEAKVNLLVIYWERGTFAWVWTRMLDVSFAYPIQGVSRYRILFINGTKISSIFRPGFFPKIQNSIPAKSYLDTVQGSGCQVNLGPISGNGPLKWPFCMKLGSDKWGKQSKYSFQGLFPKQTRNRVSSHYLQNKSWALQLFHMVKQRSTVSNQFQWWMCQKQFESTLGIFARGHQGNSQ